ncbi:hypothetical protein OROHE_014251 [Orobanche hederae]
MSSGQFNRGKGKKKTITGIPRRGKGGASGSGGTPAHTPTPNSNSIPTLNFGDYVPEDITEEQINKMFEASKSIHNIEDNEDDEQEQPAKSKQRKPSELKSPLFAVHYSKTDDVESGPGHFFVNCNYCDKIYKFRKGGYGTLNSHLQRQHPDKIGIKSNQIQLRGTTTSSNALNQDLMALLKIFKEATESLSGVYYPTSTLVVEHCFKIVLIFKSLIKVLNLFNCIKEMREKLIKYFAYIPPVFLVAKLLDPQVREESLLKLLTLYYTALFPNPIANFTPPNPSDLVQIAKHSLSALYREYACNYSGSFDLGTGSSSPVHIPSSSSISSFGFAIPNLGESNAYQEDLSQKRTRYQSNAYQELEKYLTTFDLGALERGPDGNNNLLKWWAKRFTIFHVVATIAKVILAVPASTVSVEQAFSVGGYILDERRSRLTPQNIEAQALLNDWVKASYANKN